MTSPASFFSMQSGLHNINVVSCDINQLSTRKMGSGCYTGIRVTASRKERIIYLRAHSGGAPQWERGLQSAEALQCRNFPYPGDAGCRWAFLRRKRSVIRFMVSNDPAMPGVRYPKRCRATAVQEPERGSATRSNFVRHIVDETNGNAFESGACCGSQSRAPVQGFKARILRGNLSPGRGEG